MKKTLMMIAAMATAFAMAACTSMGMATPDTFNKKTLAAYKTVQTVSEVAAANAGKTLSKSDAQNVYAVGQASIQAIQLAEQMYAASCPATAQPKVEPAAVPCVSTAADAKLQATLAILTALQAYLATQGAK